ncbi:hypothetical protein K488DRAFT_46011 [Vararia minispora EC-137]|uniref:Uncharacterized protein n=1 Tax=Vararia minispora EC-137 TaxID=1314806 RepID=A0ACB8QR76_9AGAM|nr:hypothetical protein K488DRAFT_46011 [Vararia minispora EC-137]
MPPHPYVLQYLAQNYPKPRVDEEWLESCYEWVLGENNLDPTCNMSEILKKVEEQLLGSDLRDSMQPNTGLARNIVQARKGATGAIPILVQITSVTDIGHSAFSLQSVRQMRIDRADLAGLAEQDGGEDDGPIPKYPRSMLRLELSDGTTTIKAIEYRRIPQLTLDDTPLGYKVSLLHLLSLQVLKLRSRYNSRASK